MKALSIFFKISTLSLLGNGKLKKYGRVDFSNLYNMHYIDHCKLRLHRAAIYRKADLSKVIQKKRNLRPRSPN